MTLVNVLIILHQSLDFGHCPCVEAVPIALVLDGLLVCCYDRAKYPLRRALVGSSPGALNAPVLREVDEQAERNEIPDQHGDEQHGIFDFAVDPKVFVRRKEYTSGHADR